MRELESMKYLIANITRFMKTYSANVVNASDPESKSRVMVIIPDLGITTPAEGVWADVEQPIAENVLPQVNDWLSVYFLDGDPSKPVVRGKITTAKGNVPKTTSNRPLLYKDDDLEIMFDKESKELKLKGSGKLSIESDGEITVKGSKVTVNDHLEVS